MPWQLSDIRRKVRQVAGRLSSNELSTQQVDQYINNYYQYTFPAEVKLDRKHTYYEFNTIPLQNIYTYPTNFTNFEPPVYLNFQSLLYYQSPDFFQQENWQQISQQTPWTGDGTTVAFATTVQYPNIYPESVIVTDNIETFTDDGAGILTGDLGGSGTVNYITGAITVNFASAPPNGDNIYLSYQQYQPGQPTAVLLYDNQFTFWTVPDTVYRIKMKAYKVTDPLVLATDTPDLQEWGPCIAYGAARDIFTDFGETDRYNEVTALYKEQVDYILTRTVQQLSNERAPPMW